MKYRSYKEAIEKRARTDGLMQYVFQQMAAFTDALPDDGHVVVGGQDKTVLHGKHDGPPNCRIQAVPTCHCQMTSLPARWW